MITHTGCVPEGRSPAGFTLIIGASHLQPGANYPSRPAGQGERLGGGGRVFEPSAQSLGPQQAHTLVLFICTSAAVSRDTGSPLATVKSQVPASEPQPQSGGLAPPSLSVWLSLSLSLSCSLLHSLFAHFSLLVSHLHVSHSVSGFLAFPPGFFSLSLEPGGGCCSCGAVAHRVRMGSSSGVPPKGVLVGSEALPGILASVQASAAHVINTLGLASTLPQSLDPPHGSS